VCESRFSRKRQRRALETPVTTTLHDGFVTRLGRAPIERNVDDESEGAQPDQAPDSGEGAMGC